MKTYLSLIFFLGLMPLMFGQGKLSIAPNGVVTRNDSFIDLDTLVMGHRARLRLTAPRVTLLVGHVYVQGLAIIDGKGPTGAEGKAGSNGRFDTPRRRGATDGERGGPGKPGGAGAHLDLFLNFERINGRLFIDVDGGRGGTGGTGGNGGSKRVICNQTVNLGTDGGDSGVPGRGGSPGEVRIVFGSNVGRESVKISAKPGNPGRVGKGGKPGGFQRSTCQNPRIRKVKGKPGKSTPYQGFVYNKGISLPEDHLAEGYFPLQPPTPSARMLDIPLRLSANPTMESVKDKLTQALHAVGYEENYNILRWSDGFALITNIELIEGNSGAPVAETSVRWSGSIRYQHTPSILGYLKSMIYPLKGYARVTVFTVGTSPEDNRTTENMATKAEALKWFRKIGSRLPDDLLKKPFTSGMEVNALIYEFSKKENAPSANVTPATRLTARKHLTASGILSLISGQ